MSGDVMTFPNTWEEYEETYGFNDTEQVYTNGSRLIQSFRVKQWLEHIEVSEDCISKHDIWKIIEDNAYWVRYNENSTEKGMTLTGINQALNECPPVIPTVSEDCISREYLEEQLQQIEDITAMAHIDLGEDPYDETEEITMPISTVRKIFKNAPSVVPRLDKEDSEDERIEK